MSWQHSNTTSTNTPSQLYDALEKIKNKSKDQSANDAQSFLNTLLMFQSIIITVIIHNIVSFIRALSIAREAKISNLVSDH